MLEIWFLIVSSLEYFLGPFIFVMPLVWMLFLAVLIILFLYFDLPKKSIKNIVDQKHRRIYPPFSFYNKNCVHLALPMAYDGHMNIHMSKGWCYCVIQTIEMYYIYIFCA